MGSAVRTLSNCHGIDGVVRREFEYIRRGTRTLQGALNVHTGEVLGRVVEHRTVDALVAFMEDVARRYRGKQVYVVLARANRLRELGLREACCDPPPAHRFRELQPQSCDARPFT